MLKTWECFKTAPSCSIIFSSLAPITLLGKIIILNLFKKISMAVIAVWSFWQNWSTSCALQLCFWCEDLNKYYGLRSSNETVENPPFRGEICQCRHCRRQCKVFASSVYFSIFTHFLCFFLLKLLKWGEIDGVKFFAWKSGGVKFWTNSMSGNTL